MSGPNLPVHSGINAQAVRSIPPSWTPQWFKRFITNHLQWADFRNAIAGPGITISGTEQQQGTISAIPGAYTAATLPASPVQGQPAIVTDALTPVFLGALTGGGTTITPVFFNGTAWVVG